MATFFPLPGCCCSQACTRALSSSSLSVSFATTTLSLSCGGRAWYRVQGSLGSLVQLGVTHGGLGDNPQGPVWLARVNLHRRGRAACVCVCHGIGKLTSITATMRTDYMHSQHITIDTINIYIFPTFRIYCMAGNIGKNNTQRIRHSLFKKIGGF